MASKTTKKKQKTLRQLWYTVFPRKKSWSGEAYYDYNLLACVILLTCFGLVMLYSTSAYTAKVKYGSDMAFFGKQAVIRCGLYFWHDGNIQKRIITGLPVGELCCTEFPIFSCLQQNM